MMLWLKRNNFVLFDFRYCLECCFTCTFDCFGENIECSEIVHSILRFSAIKVNPGTEGIVETLHNQEMTHTTSHNNTEHNAYSNEMVWVWAYIIRHC